MLQLLTLQNGLRTTGSANNPNYNILERWWFGSIGTKKEYYCLVVIQSQEIQLRWRLNTPNDYLSWPIEIALLGIGSSIRLATARYSKVVSKICCFPCFTHVRVFNTSVTQKTFIHRKDEKCSVFSPRLRVAGRLRLVLPFPAVRLASQWRRRRPPARFVVWSIGLPVATKVDFVETIQLSFGLSLNTIPLVITHTIPYLCMVKLYIYIWIFMAKKVNDTWMPCVKGSQTQTDKERQIHCA